MSRKSELLILIGFIAMVALLSIDVHWFLLVLGALVVLAVYRWAVGQPSVKP